MSFITQAKTLAAAAITALCASVATAAMIGDPAVGRRIALETCSICHLVETGQKRPADVGAPSFAALARDPAVTEFRIRAFLQTPHRVMPNFVLKPEEMDDVVAYMLSLRENR